MPSLLQGVLPAQGPNPRLLCLLCWQVDSSPLAPPGKASWTNARPKIIIIKKECLCNNVDETRDDRAERRKSQRKQTFCDITYTWNRNQRAYVRSGDRLTESSRTDLWPGRREWGRDGSGVCGEQTQTSACRVHHSITLLRTRS